MWKLALALIGAVTPAALIHAQEQPPTAPPDTVGVVVGPVTVVPTKEPYMTAFVCQKYDAHPGKPNAEGDLIGGEWVTDEFGDKKCKRFSVKVVDQVTEMCKELGGLPPSLRGSWLVPRNDMCDLPKLQPKFDDPELTACASISMRVPGDVNAKLTNEWKTYKVGCPRPVKNGDKLLGYVEAACPAGLWCFNEPSDL